MNATISTDYHDDWADESTVVNGDIAAILARLDAQTEVMALSDLLPLLSESQCADLSDIRDIVQGID